LSIDENESPRTEERSTKRSPQSASNGGDVIWSAASEKDAKFMGASADVADKIAKRLVADYRARKWSSKPESRTKPEPATK
jgi:hypothetical protein